MANSTLKKVFLFAGIALVGLILVIQLVPVSRDNPPVTQEIQWDSAETCLLVQNACYDCHSNETDWPWYSYVAPISWRVVNHVHHGREHLNFSEWDRPNEEAEQIIEVITSGEMPLWDYLLLHPEADLSRAETQALLNGLKQTLANDPPLD